MRIALVGHGKMGKMVEQAALQRGHEVVSIIDPNGPQAGFREITAGSVKNADVCIDFSSPESALENIKKLCSLHKNIVVGTTGWYAGLDAAKKLVKDGGNGLIYASNFSIGMNILFRLADDAGKIFDKFPEYDVGGVEYHHNQKADSPSGTAKSLAEILLKRVKRKKAIEYGMAKGKIAQDAIHFPSLRTGFIPGTHKIIFDSSADTVELSHTARSREGFAVGAVVAAEWLKGKKGFYGINDLLGQILA